MSNRRNQGFTLLEVLIALVILAIAAAGLTRASMSAAQHSEYLTLKTLASVVAVNKIREIQIARTWPDVGMSDDSADMAGQSWHITMDVDETDVKTLRRVRIGVTLKDKDAEKKASDEAPLYLLTGFVGQH